MVSRAYVEKALTRPSIAEGDNAFLYERVDPADRTLAERLQDEIGDDEQCPEEIVWV